MGEPGTALSISGLTDETTLLISGPPMTGKYQLTLRLLAEACDGVVLVTTKNRGSRVAADYRALAGTVPPDRIGIIDCVSHPDRAGGEEHGGPVKYVQSPGNLTRIGVAFTELLDQYAETAGPNNMGLGIHSLSQIMMHTDVKRLYQFLQVLTGQIRNAGWMGVAVIDDSVADEGDLSLLHHHFDGVVNTRENEAGDREFRVKGLTPSTSEWRRF